MKPVYINYSLRSMAALSGALLSGEAAERRAKEWRSSRPDLLAVSLPSPAYIAWRAQPKPPCYASYINYY